MIMQTRCPSIRYWKAAGAPALLLVLAACASPGKPPAGEMAAARASIAEAESVGAVQQAPVDLLSAREKFGKAEAAIRDKRYVQAQRLAEEAQVDAEVAQQKARVVKAQATATELERSNQLLRQETERQVRP